MQRINWIDWAKTLTVISVVFCHLPQSQEWFYYRYLQACTIIIFIFISGYLKKDRGNNKENWRKYWHGLIIPYIIYNLIIYPYWIVKYYLLNGVLPNFYQAVRPLLGALLFEHENTFSEPLNGPLWYLPAILLMHILIDLCRKTKHQHRIMVSLCLISFVLYAANKYYYFAPNLTPMGVMRNLPFYYIGYLFGHYRLFRGINYKHDFIGCVICLFISILLFSWHLHTFYTGQHLLHIIIFYPVNIGFLFGVLYCCKLLNNIHTDIIVNISIGTLVIIGLHIVPISIANYTLEHLLHINNTIYYHWYEALPVTIITIMVLYPIIIWGKKNAPTLLGRKRTKCCRDSIK